MLVLGHCDWFILPLLLATPTIWLIHEIASDEIIRDELHKI